MLSKCKCCIAETRLKTKTNPNSGKKGTFTCIIFRMSELNKFILTFLRKFQTNYLKNLQNKESIKIIKAKMNAISFIDRFH